MAGRHAAGRILLGRDRVITGSDRGAAFADHDVFKGAEIAHSRIIKCDGAGEGAIAAVGCAASSGELETIAGALAGSEGGIDQAGTG